MRRLTVVVIIVVVWQDVIHQPITQVKTLKTILIYRLLIITIKVIRNKMWAKIEGWLNKKEKSI
jgi:hypothetical protein